MEISFKKTIENIQESFPEHIKNGNIIIEEDHNRLTVELKSHSTDHKTVLNKAEMAKIRYNLKKYGFVWYPAQYLYKKFTKDAIKDHELMREMTRNIF